MEDFSRFLALFYVILEPKYEDYWVELDEDEAVEIRIWEIFHFYLF